MLLLLPLLLVGLIAAVIVMARPLSRPRMVALVLACVACMTLAGLAGAAIADITSSYFREATMRLIADADGALQAGEVERVAAVFAEARARRESGESSGATLHRAVRAFEQPGQ